MAALAVAGPASASTATQSVRSFIFPVKATTTVRTEANGNGGIWATVTVQRTATVSGGAPVLPSQCGPGASRCFAYSAVVKDTGSFRTYRFALTPNQFLPGRHIRSIVTGRVDGSYSFAFFASTTPNAFIVPGFFSGPFSAVAGWPKLFFPFGTRCGPQRWIDSSANGHGNLPLDGNITGC